MKNKFEKEIVFSTKWFNIEEKIFNNHEVPYYILNTLDYVAILALTNKNKVILVKQFRPVLNRISLELPCGHVEEFQTPEEAAKAELLEETGYEAGKLELLGVLDPDVGRLSNKLWCYFTSDINLRNDVKIEEGISTIEYNICDLLKLIKNGEFNSSVCISTISLCILNNKIQFNN